MKNMDWLAAGIAATMGGALLYVFRCHHMKTSFPITRQGMTYITCTGCGSHRLYDTKAMRGYGPWSPKLETLERLAQAPSPAAVKPAGT